MVVEEEGSESAGPGRLTGEKRMRRIADEDGLVLDQAGLEFHVDQVPELHAVVRRLVKHTQDSRSETSKVAHELLLVRALVISGQACRK